ncbi:MAG: hypothetical protein QM705_14765 [Ancrocorticia sp.]
MAKKSRKGRKLTGKQKAQIWCEVVRHIAPMIQALAFLLAVLILIG